MKNWDVEDFAIAVIVVGAVLAVLCAFGWALYDCVDTRHEQSRCRERGGDAVRPVGPFGEKGDWRCVMPPRAEKSAP